MQPIHRWHPHYQDATSDKIYTVGVYADPSASNAQAGPRDPPQPMLFTVLWGRRLAPHHISQTRAQSLTHSQAFSLALDFVTAKQRKGYDLIEQPDLRMLAAPPLTAPQPLHTSAPKPTPPIARKLRF
ncbi:MAG: hypothetical protein HY713_07160 [candidate division NC10 bacterium]|nr:hypothetical protein [candidate division NC10 bacterium]